MSKSPKSLTGNRQRTRQHTKKTKVTTLLDLPDWETLALGCRAAPVCLFYLPILVFGDLPFPMLPGSMLSKGFHLDSFWYRSLLQGNRWNCQYHRDARIWDALNNSLLIAAISSPRQRFCTMMALALERFLLPGRSAMEAILFLPIIIPETTMGISFTGFLYPGVFSCWRI